MDTSLQDHHQGKERRRAPCCRQEGTVGDALAMGLETRNGALAMGLETRKFSAPLPERHLVSFPGDGMMRYQEDWSSRGAFVPCPQTPELGKPRRSCYSLPGYDFNYGLYLHGTDGGVPEAIGHWNSIKPRAPSAKERGRDYKTMNRKAVQEGYVTAHEQNLYRQLKDIRLSDNDERRFKKAPPKVPPDMTYGRPARPSTPFFDLLQHKYKEIWMEQQRAIIRAQKEEKKQKKRKGKVYETYTSLLRKFQPPMKTEQLWRIPHFQKVSPHLCTFPDQDARKRALEVIRSEIPVRCGPLAMGIYTAA